MGGSSKISSHHLTAWIRKCIEDPLVPQRSQEWFRLRKTRITGSMCDTLLGTNRFQTWDEVVAEKAGMPVTFQGSAATQHGIDLEEEAILLYAKETDRTVVELGLTKHPHVDILAHSPDGISLKRRDDTRDASVAPDRPILLEVKCPYTREIKPGVVPKYYMGQLQLGLSVFDLEQAHFVQYRRDPYVLDITTVTREEGWLQKHLPTFYKFWEEVEYWKATGWRRHPHFQKKRRQDMFKGMGDATGVVRRRVAAPESPPESPPASPPSPASPPASPPSPAGCPESETSVPPGTAVTPGTSLPGTGSATPGPSPGPGDPGSTASPSQTSSG